MSFFFKLTAILIAILYYPVVFFKNRINRKKPTKILISQTAKIGDMVCTTPFFREAKKVFPDAKLIVLGNSWNRPILELNPRVDDFIELDSFIGFSGLFKLARTMKNMEISHFFNVNPNGWFQNLASFFACIPNRVVATSEYESLMSKLARIFCNFKLELRLGYLKSKFNLDLLRFFKNIEFDEKKEVYFSEQAEQKAKEFLIKNSAEQDFVIGMSVVAGNIYKQWGIENFAKLADRIINLGIKVVFTGSNSDKKKILEAMDIMETKAIDSSGEFKLIELPALINSLKAFIALDSGPIYIANALDVPIVDISGSSVIEEQLILSKKVIAVKSNMYEPFSHVFPTPVNGYEERYKECFESISVDMVFDAFINLLKLNYPEIYEKINR